MTCYIFDLGGVVTHVEEKTITNPALLSTMVSLLDQGNLLTINTGRSLSFVRREVLTPLATYIQQHNLPTSLFHNIFAVGEKGNAWIEDEKDCYDMSHAIPKDLAEKIYAYVEKEHPLASFDRTKRTMVSVESKKGVATEDFVQEKEAIAKKFKDFLEEFHVSNEFVLDTSITSVDIQHKTAGKALGVQKIFSWLTKRKLDPEEYIAFGDSVADIGTGVALQKVGKNFTFVFVGKPALLTTHPGFPITYTKDHYDKGVLEYFSIDNM